MPTPRSNVKKECNAVWNAVDAKKINPGKTASTTMVAERARGNETNSVLN